MDAGNAERFAQLKGFVSGEKGELSYAEAAERIGLTPGAVKSAIFRLRRRYHELIREEVSQTVADPREIEDELRYLLGAIQCRLSRTRQRRATLGLLFPRYRLGKSDGL